MLINKHLRILLGILLCGLHPSCQKDIDLYSNAKNDQVIVYGILDCSDKSQTVKIGKMLKPDATGADFMNVSTPVQSDSLVISVQEWANGYYSTYEMNPSEKQENPHMTVFTGLFEPFDFMEYKLVITNRNTGDIITAKTLPLADPKILKPAMSNISCTFGDTLNPFEFKYLSIPRGMVYQLQLIIQYVDYTLAGDTVFQEGVFAFNPVYVDDPPEYIPTRVNYGKDITRSFPPDYLLNIFARVISSSARVEKRRLFRLNFTIWAGNDVLRKYLEMASKYEDDRKQFFSNINGGYGLFAASSHNTVNGIKPDDLFLDSLANGQTTRQLKFEDKLYQDWCALYCAHPSLSSTILKVKNDEGH